MLQSKKSIRTERIRVNCQFEQCPGHLAYATHTPLVDYFALACLTDSRTMLVLDPWMGLSNNPFALASFCNSA